MTDNTLIGHSKISDRIFANILDYGVIYSLTILYVYKIGQQNADGVYQVSGLAGRQRTYLLYFSSAKQAKTREERVAKYTKQILNGKGLND